LNNDKEKIREVFEEVYAANVRSGDLQGYASMYSEDALWMPPDAPDRRGVEDILEAFEMQVAKDVPIQPSPQKKSKLWAISVMSSVRL